MLVYRKDDKLIPIVTATVYWGDEPWDGPVNLKSMFDELDEDVDTLINDYNCNLFSIIDAERLPEYRTGLGELFNVLRLRNSKEGKYNMCKAIEELKRDSADEALIKAVRNIMEKEKRSFENVCMAMGINKTDMARYRKMI